MKEITYEEWFALIQRIDSLQHDIDDILPFVVISIIGLVGLAFTFFFVSFHSKNE